MTMNIRAIDGATDFTKLHKKVRTLIIQTLNKCRNYKNKRFITQERAIKNELTRTHIDFVCRVKSNKDSYTIDLEFGIYKFTYVYDVAKIDNVKKWYQKAFPMDDEGHNINPDITFTQLWEDINKYTELLCGDSIVRERVFERLGDLNAVPYGTVYNMWLSGEYC